MPLASARDLSKARVTRSLDWFEVPTGYASFPGDGVMPSPPRSRIDAVYNLTHWQAFDKGGHFAAMEQPDLFVDDVRRFFATAH